VRLGAVHARAAGWDAAAVSALPAAGGEAAQAGAAVRGAVGGVVMPSLWDLLIVADLVACRGPDRDVVAAWLVGRWFREPWAQA